ncbi:U11/U12 small nuclear ribonucleoprotein 25 kDa protein [Cardamine amara subsp. amara]|uniref:U11/U12 small nuclear ribonucleoprotein 25 kDa protein n=1 Tax=Cardamine amara subsp. amara TaxID=228776 RepID=A0ABD0ZZU0_CARAN
MREEHSPGRDRRRRSSGSGGLRALIEPRCLSPFALNDGGSVSGRRSSYLKLPPQGRITISVVKLNGSLFDVEIAKDCSVAELKRAVEEVFTISPQEGLGRISWSHVWGHFCLCYRDQRLVNDKTSIRNLGLNDGDQLHFVRYLSIDHSPLNKRSKSQSCRRYLELEVETNANQIQTQNQNQNDVDNVADKCYPGAQDELPPPEYKLVHLIKGWLPYAGNWGVSRKGPESRSRPSRFSLKHFSGRPKM